MQYGLIIWGADPHVDRVFKLQKKAVRILTKAKYNAHCVPLFRALKIMTLPSLFVFVNLLYAKRNLSKFQIVEEIHSHNTRSASDIRLPFHSVNKQKYGPNYWSLKLYNALPLETRALPENSFKKVMKKQLSEICLYKFKDFLN